MFKKNASLYSAFPQVVTVTVPRWEENSMTSTDHIITNILPQLGIKGCSVQ